MKTLIVEDDLMSQCLLAQVLTERGHEVVTYENAEQAILAYQKQFFPLLFVDAGLPGMDGLQFCRWVRSQTQGERVFIMVAVSPGEPNDLSQILDTGANDYLAKPYDVAALNVRLAIAEGQMKDFFERKELEASLRQSREAFDRVVNTAGEGVWLLNAQFHADYVNPQMAALLDSQIEESLQRPVTDFLAEPARPETQLLFERQKQGEPIREELAFRRKDGTECRTLLSAAPIRSADGEFRGSLWLVTDLSERTALEAELLGTREQWQQQVRDLAGELNNAAAALQAETAERKSREQSLERARGDLERLEGELAAERTRTAEAVNAATADREKLEAELARTRDELNARAGALGAKLNEAKEALRAEGRGRQEAEEELARTTRELKTEQRALNQAEDELHKTRAEMDARIRADAAQLARLDQLLQTEIAERKRLAELWQQTRQELEARSRQHAAELDQAEKTLAAEQAERKRAERDLDKAREDLAARLREHSDELLKLDQQLKAEIADRRRTEEELLRTREEMAHRVREHMAEVVKADDELKAVLAERKKAEDELHTLAKALERVNEELQAETGARTRAEVRSAAFGKLGHDLGAARTPDEVARISAGAAQDLLGWDAYSCDLYSSDENRIRPLLNIETVNGRPADVPPTYRGPEPSPIMVRVLKDGPQLILRSGPSSSHTDYILFGDRARLSASLMDVPIRAGGKAIGFLSAQSYTADAYDQEDLETLQLLADHCGAALQRIGAEEGRRRLEQRFHLTARVTSEVVWDWNLETDQVWWNDSFQTLFGYLPEEIEPGAESRNSRIHPEERSRVISGLEAFTQSHGEYWSDEYRFRRRDGSYAHVLDRAYAVRQEGGKLLRMIGAMADLSQREQIEATLIEGRGQPGAILAAAADAIVAINAQGNVVEWNLAAEKMFGYRRADVVGKELAELIIPGRWQERHRAGMSRLLSAPGSGPGAIVDRRIELEAKRADGAEFPIEMTVTRSEAEGSPIFTACLRDITEQKRAEMEAQKLAAFARWNPNPVFEFGADGALTYFNDAAKRLASSLGKEHPSAILPPDTADIVKECLSQGQNKRRLETTAAGRTIAWSFVPIGGAPVVHCYACETTERLHHEAQLWQAQKMESIGQLAAGMAHDFNNLLSVIQGYSTLLLEEPDAVKPETAEALKHIRSATERATHLTRQLLTFSRRQTLNRTPVDLHEVINNASKLMRRAIGESIALQFNYSPGLPAVEADVALMEQVIMNLVENARETMPQGGQLTIGTRVVTVADTDAQHHPEARPGRFVSLSVTDTGPGMDEATLARVFEPFSTTKTGGKRSGLRLATVYGIVKQHEGWIEAHSQVGHGTSFRIFLPVSAKTIAPAEETPRRPALRGGTETILLVEDELAVLTMAKGILQRLGYQVFSAQSGDDALPVWREQAAKIDLLLTDMMMPGSLNGRELAEKLLQEKPGLKVLYTSGYSMELIGPGLATSKGFVFLQKPYHPEILAETVRKCLDGKTS